MNPASGHCRPADNPFASHRTEDLALRYHELDPEALARRVGALGRRVAIVGPKGSGKTTLLEQLAAILPGRSVLVRIPGGCARPYRSARRQLPRPVTRDDVVLVDGGEQLGPVGWRLLLRATRVARGLVATLHRPGRLPTLIECRTDPALLRELVADLAPEDAGELDATLDGLFDRHGGNIRSCFRELYDVYAGRSSFEF